CSRWSHFSSTNGLRCKPFVALGGRPPCSPAHPCPCMRVLPKEPRGTPFARPRAFVSGSSPNLRPSSASSGARKEPNVGNMREAGTVRRRREARELWVLGGGQR